jgi:type I restriction enzyme M protein
LLNTKIIKRQIEAKTFVQATLSTLGNRLSELVLPIHKDKKEIERIENEVKEIIKQKTDLRERCVRIIEEKF